MKKIIALLVSACAFFAGCNKTNVTEITLSGTGIKTQTFSKIQDALDTIGISKGTFTINLPKGTYNEVLYYNGSADITISGCTEAKYGEDVVISIDNNGDLLRCDRTTGQKARCVFEFEGTGNLTLENLTVHNTFLRSEKKVNNGQAETIGFDSTGKLAAYNCAFKSYQDTLRMTGKAWFYKCYVEGDTDFIWMEASGKVALFEECELVSLYDKFHNDPTSYIGAPRMDKGNKASKGLVIFNSSIATQEGETTYLARTPWNSGYYNQVAFVNNTVNGDIEASLWKGKALTAHGIPETIIGWKIDRKTADAIGAKVDGRKDILSDAAVANEFSGRETILNRYYDLSTLKYKKDLENYWDVKKLASSHGWKVSKDSSKSLLSGEENASRTVYTFSDTTQNKDVVLDGFAVEGDKLVGYPGQKITFPVKGKSVVSVTGCLGGNGTIKSEKQGAAFYDFNTGSATKFAEKAYVVYEGASTITITATTKTTISKIVVESDRAVEFTPVSSIAISSEDNAEMVYGRKSLQFYAKINPPRPTNADYEWTVSDPTAATIDQTGFLTAAELAEDKDIIVKATAKDEKAASAEFKLHVSKPDPNAVGLSWLTSLDASKSLEGASDNPLVAKANKAIPSPGNWVYNGSKINADFAKGGITYTGYSGTIAGKDTLYVDFPVTAVESLEITKIDAAFGNHGTSNVAVLIQGISGSKKTELVVDESRQVRSLKKTYELDTPFLIKKGETAKIRVVLYGRDGNGECAIAGGKAPTVATITLSGSKK
ncbi:pectinesterase family protein [Treponema sp.]|uniref:pectinesterase family protein n=1 Tax=Treponema sp. TaxID=166 RepID=UPI0025CCFB73|nr:pectinesterase family protein [Treponema sp.]MBR4323175.1 Ig-like domain-containing protein [Treponema sp.]